MGNTASGEDDASNCLQTQDSEHLWSIERWSEDECCEFIGSPSEGPKSEPYQRAIQQLLKLRHPNILKFISSHSTHESIVMTTELVIPLSPVLASYKFDGLVSGWRDLATGLGFLHDPKLGISHNNLHVGNVFVGGPNTQWKIGGFEAALAHKEITQEFLKSVAPIRHSDAVPPEDKKRSASATEMAVHCRDMWALGKLILQCLEESEILDSISEQPLSFVNERMLHKDPQQRPESKDLLCQPWMSNNVTAVVEFLNNLVLKTQKQKDAFFSSLAATLHSVPPEIVARHVVPLLLTPLVMAEPNASSHLWMHLLCPASADRPRPEVFDPQRVCPLLPEDLYKSHLLPYVINLLSNREYCVRSVLLKHFDLFAGSCKHDDLTTIVLPEILVGMKDDHNELVSDTLVALATLVTLLGATVVMGTNQKRVFTDVQPRKAPAVSTPVSTPTDNPLSVPPPSNITAPSAASPSRRDRGSREERAEMMRRKREEQRRKRSMGSTKQGLGLVSAGKLPSTDAGLQEESGETQPESVLAQSTTTEETGSSDNEDEKEEGDEEWQGFEPDHQDWDSGWTRNEKEGGGDSCPSSPSSATGTASSLGSGKAPESSSRPSSSPTMAKPKAMRLSKSKKSSSKPQTQSAAKLTQSTTASSVSNSYYTLSKEDTERLEEQSHWASVEPDLFGDMAPVITTPPNSSLPASSLSKNGRSCETGSHKTSLAPSLDYRPQEAEVEGWADGWDNDF